MDYQDVFRVGDTVMAPPSHSASLPSVVFDPRPGLLNYLMDGGSVFELECHLMQIFGNGTPESLDQLLANHCEHMTWPPGPHGAVRLRPTHVYRHVPRDVAAPASMVHVMVACALNMQRLFTISKAPYVFYLLCRSWQQDAPNETTMC